MKVLFLDIDGVLNIIRSAKIFGYQYIDDAAVSLVANIIKETDAKIVLSSSWRLTPPDIELVEKALSPHNLEIFDCTPVINPPIDSEYDFIFRSKEIQSWLDSNTIEKFAILDDDPRANIEGSFFQIDENVGLTMKMVERVINHLNA